jgi:hypothetical protein
MRHVAEIATQKTYLFTQFEEVQNSDLRKICANVLSTDLWEHRLLMKGPWACDHIFDPGT